MGGRTDGYSGCLEVAAKSADRMPVFTLSVGALGTGTAKIGKQGVRRSGAGEGRTRRRGWEAGVEGGR